MKQRRFVLGGITVCVVALALAATNRRLGPEAGITEANVGRIRPGMALEEVEAILGEFSGDLLFGGRRTDRLGLKAMFNEPDFPELVRNGPVVTREGGEGYAAISFREDGRVEQAKWTPMYGPGTRPFKKDVPKTSLLACFRSWIGW